MQNFLVNDYTDPLQTLQDIETYNTIIVKSSFKVIAMVIIVTYLIFSSQI